MDGIGFLLIALATAFNLLIIKHKLEKHRYEDGITDLVILAVLTVVFGGSYGGLVVATITSAIISLYFLANPPHFFRLKSNSKATSDFFYHLKRALRRPYE
jgi:uncharacterized membrane protein